MVWAVLSPSLGVASGSNQVFETNTLLLVVLLLSAKWLGFLCSKFGIPELVGEIFAGIALGNLALLGIDYPVTETLLHSGFMQYGSELAVILLLFLVGLESNLKELMKVGINATVVAFLGVVFPVFLGAWMAPALGIATGLSAWFVGATLAATSVGITAKVLKEKNVLKAKSSQVILAAAVIDDVLGILLLAILAGILADGAVSVMSLGMITLKTVLFFVGSFIFAQIAFPRVIRITSVSENSGFWAGSALAIALLFAQVSAWAGLAPIIGAFVGGLLLDDVHFVTGHKIQKHNFEHLLMPVMDVLLPIFFVSIGAQVNLTAFTDFGTILAVVLVLIMAIFSKGIAGIFIRGEGFDKIGIGLGMIPRGEVGLIFAAFAIGHHVFTEKSYSILVLVVLLTTVLGPILLKPRLAKF